MLAYQENILSNVQFDLMFFVPSSAKFIDCVMSCVCSSLEGGNFVGREK